jgi:hypothetical protein
MLRHIVALFAAVLVGLAVFAWLESYSSSESAKTTSNQSKDRNNSVIIVFRSYARCTEKFADLHNALITALATVLLAVITSGLIWSGVEQLKTNRAQLRGYVFVSGARAINVSENAGIPEAHVVIKNFGQTPVYKVMNVSGIAADQFPAPATLDLTIRGSEFGSPRRSKSDLGPTQSEESITSAGRALTDHERQAVATGNGAVWVMAKSVTLMCLASANGPNTAS